MRHVGEACRATEDEHVCVYITHQSGVTREPSDKSELTTPVPPSPKFRLILRIVHYQLPVVPN